MSQTPGSRVLIGIVEDHPIVAAGTARVLSATRGLHVAWTAGDLDEARTQLAIHPVDVVVVDIRLGASSGLELLANASTGQKRRGRHPAFVVLTGYDYPQYRAAATRLGAAALVVKLAPIEDLVEAIRRAASGHTDATVPAGRLPTVRDLEVVRLVAAGRTNAEIAGSLGLSQKTVEGRLARLFSRFGVGSRAELATRAVLEGWLDIPGA